MLKKNFLKLTRKSYRRKLILFGAAIFMSLALTATGFAAFILSQDAKVGADGSVQVGAVTESNIEITPIVFVDDDKQFEFEPQEGDTSGRVRNDGENFEDLDLTLTWTIKNYGIVNQVTIDFYIPESIENAINAGYITLAGSGLTKVGGPVTPELPDENIEGNFYLYQYIVPTGIVANGENADKTVSWVYTAATQTADAKVDFTLTLKFAWGTAFKGDNPGIYFDKLYDGDTNKEFGKNIKYDTVKLTLDTMKATMCGLSYDDYMKLSEEQKGELTTPNYWVIVNATIS